RVIGDPAPGIAAADLPLIALPGLDRRVLADGLAELGRLGVEQNLVVGSLRIRPPRLRSVLDVVGGDVPGDAVLPAADADEHFVLDHQWSARGRFGLLRIAVFDAPQL